MILFVYYYHDDINEYFLNYQKVFIHFLIIMSLLFMQYDNHFKNSNHHYKELILVYFSFIHLFRIFII